MTWLMRNVALSFFASLLACAVAWGSPTSDFYEAVSRTTSAEEFRRVLADPPEDVSADIVAALHLKTGARDEVGRESGVSQRERQFDQRDGTFRGEG